jgi:hypothetical protein
MLRLKKNLTPESWLREGLGVWDEFLKHQPVIKPSVWQALSDPGPADGAKPSALAVDMSHQREISICACWPNGETAHVEEVWAGLDAGAAVDWLLARSDRRTQFVIDNVSPAASFIPVLRREKRKVMQTGAGDMGKACGLLESMAENSTVTHGDQKAVNDALAGARKRPIQGAGGFGWDRRDESVNIAPIVSATLALLGGMTKRRTGTGGATFA